MIDEAEIRRHYELLRPDLDERGRRLWKRELQALADETGLSIQVSHYPPGTSGQYIIGTQIYGRGPVVIRG